MEATTRIDPLTLPEIVDIIIPFLDKKRFLTQAAVVCKAWNQLYTPILWRDMGIVRLGSNTILNFERQGIHVRQLQLVNLENRNFDLVAPFCPNVDDLTLWYCSITLERLAPYLRTLAPKLKRLQLEAVAVSPNELVSTIGAESPHEEDGIDGGPPLEELRLMFFASLGQPVALNLSLDTLVRLLEVRSDLKKVDLSCVRIPDLVTAIDNGRSLVFSEDKTATMTMAVALEELDGGRGLQDDRVVGTQSTLTHLCLRVIDIEDRTLVLLLEKTPRLKSLNINGNDSLRGHFLDSLPILCSEITHLTMVLCRSIPASAYSRFLRPSSSDRRALCLEFLHLHYCDLDDQSLQYLASTQGDTLFELDLRYCKNVTDSGVMAMLSGCHRLASLSFYETPNVSVAIMMEDGPAERWSCCKSLKRLEIHGLGVVELPSRHAEDDPRIEQNRGAFRKVQRRIRMLPNLKVLAMNVSGVDEELIQGFLGIEEQEDGLEAGGTRRDDAVETADETGKVRLTDENTGGGAATAGLSRSTARTLVGPLLQTLRIRGLKQGGLVSNEIDRFIENYPGLKTLYASQSEDSLKEMKDRLREAGIELEVFTI